jgi:dTDP-glucose 4,6-dehydratase
MLRPYSYCATLKNLATVQDYPNYSFHHGDVTDPDSVRGCLRKYAIDTVLHFAAHSHVDLSFGNSFTFTHTNCFGTHVLLEAAKEAEVKLFLHVSTDEVYGEVADAAADLLETALLAPTNPYAASKAAAEMMVHACVPLKRGSLSRSCEAQLLQELQAARHPRAVK